MSRRANGEGSIFKEKTGRYRIAISVWKEGKRKQVTRTAWKHADALAILKEMRREADANSLSSERIDVEAFINRWLDNVIRSHRAPNTASNYELTCKKYLIPRLGSIQLKRLSPLQIESMFADLEREKAGGSARQAIHRIGCSALNHAVSLGLVEVNPFSKIRRPKHEQRKMRPFSLYECNRIIQATERTEAGDGEEPIAGGRYGAFFRLAFTTGMRLGELFGLRWDHINLTDGYLVIDQQLINTRGRSRISRPKTKSANRKISLTQEAVASLLRHKAIMMKCGFAGSQLVFLSPLGKMENFSNFHRRVWKPLLSHLVIEHRGIHNSRHAFATISLEAGIPLPVISRQIGHASPSTTLNTYIHAIESHEKESVKKIGKLFG